MRTGISSVDLNPIPCMCVRVLARIWKLPVRKPKNCALTNFRWDKEVSRLVSGIVLDVVSSINKYIGIIINHLSRQNLILPFNDYPPNGQVDEWLAKTLMCVHVYSCRYAYLPTADFSAAIKFCHSTTLLRPGAHLNAKATQCVTCK